MRSPEFEIGTNTSVTIWSGGCKWSNGGNTLNCNQTGGWVIYNNATEAARYYKIQFSYYLDIPHEYAVASRRSP